MGGVPSKPGDASVKFQVLGAGYSRTGTQSVQIALEKLLGEPVMHGGSFLMRGSDAYPQKWVQAYDARRDGKQETVFKIIRDQMKGFAGCTDMPMVDFLPEFLEVYPDAKVVLVTRDPERWWASIGVNLKYATPWYLPYLTLPYPCLRWFPLIEKNWRRNAMDMLTRYKGEGTPFDSQLIEVHTQWVKDVVPKDRLLIMDLKDGWAPLCNFLGKPIPDEPFPRVNEMEAIETGGKQIFANLILLWAAIFAVTGTAGYYGFRLLANN